MLAGKKKPQFQGVSVFDADCEYIAGAMAERKGMAFTVYAQIPAEPDLERLHTYTIRSTTPDVILQGTFQSVNGKAYVFSDIQLAR